MTIPRLTGIMPLRNGVLLGYPFELAIRSLQALCDEVIVGVDPADDDTLPRVRALGVRVHETRWDMSNHDGHRNCEITVRTRELLDLVPDGWVFSLQADEVIHEQEVDSLRAAVRAAEHLGVTGLEMRRLYFYGGLDVLREDWTLWMVRLFRKGAWTPDVDGAMRFNPVDVFLVRRLAGPSIWHYSRMGDPALVAERVRNLDRLFHPPEAVASGPLPPYDYSRARKLDTYVTGTEPEDAGAVLRPFDASRHPAAALELFR